MRLNRGRLVATTLVCILTLVLATSAKAGAASSPNVGHPASSSRAATLHTFASHWLGHERTLTIGPRGHAREAYSEGCCDAILKLRFVVSHPTGTHRDALARARVTRVNVEDPSGFSASNPPPHVGEVRYIRLRNHVLHEHITHLTYCDMTAELRSVCGA